MTVICDFVYFSKAHEKQQVFMQTIKVCVCVCVCVRERERERVGERERQNRRSEFTSQAQIFYVFVSCF